MFRITRVIVVLFTALLLLGALLLSTGTLP
jgi:hypothetical protein